MPLYGAQNPPFAIYPGDVVKPFDAETITALTQASQQYALAPTVGGTGPGGRTVAWQTSFAAAPGAVSITLEVADIDADSEYQTLDTSTNVNGERRQILGVLAKFVRVKMGAQTNGTAVTVRLSV